MRGALALLAAAALLGGCMPGSARPRRPGLKGVRFHRVPAGATSFTVSFRIAGSDRGRARFSRQGLRYDVRLDGLREPGCLVSDPEGAEAGEIREVGRVELEDSGYESLLIVREESGSATRTRTLTLADPRRCRTASLSLAQRDDPGDLLTKVERSAGFTEPALAAAREFLEAAKYAYGYVGPDVVAREKDNPRFAFHHWKSEHGAADEGAFAPRRYKGPPAFSSSVSASLRDGSMEYLGYFKAGVVAYDRRADEHWVLYHPRDAYTWPTVLRKHGDFLLVGTRGDGVAVVNLRANRFKRYRFDDRFNDVQSLEVSGSKVLVNGEPKLELPSF